MKNKVSDNFFLRKRSQAAHLSVEDNGIGVPEHQ